MNARAGKGISLPFCVALLGYGKKGQRLKDGQRCIEKSCVYKADFVYRNKDGQLVVEDSKGYRDPSSATYAKFVIKRKLMLWRYGIKITEL